LNIDIISDIFIKNDRNLFGTSTLSKIEKLIEKIFVEGQVSYNDAERILLYLGFDLETSSSHYIFRKVHYVKTISIKNRSQLLPYQIKILRKVLLDHGYEK
jgi:hypothetical protein